MFFIEWAIGYFGAESILLISYLTGLILTFVFYILSLMSNWKTNITISFLIISIVSIFINMTEINKIFLFSIMIILIIPSLYFLPKNKIKNTIIPNIISIFLIFFVFISGIFIIINNDNNNYLPQTKVHTK